MNKIKFSHEYPKLHGQRYCHLVEVLVLQADSLHPDLVEYDTKYESHGQHLIPDSEGRCWEYYELPKKGQLIQLIFMGDKGIPFCTLRRYTDQKIKYYAHLIKAEFEIVRTWE